MDINTLFDHPGRRRWWLLTQALASAPMQQALELARAADQFIGADPKDLKVEMLNRELAAEPVSAASVCVTQIAKSEQATGRLRLLAEQRDQLIERIARGEKNSALAAEFGLTPKQVQGVRMGAARQIALRRTASRTAPSDKQEEPIAATVDDVIRYLRQQDDVVVPEGGNQFLVNARFHLDLAELVARANRSRVRQKKARFQLSGVNQAGEAAPAPLSKEHHPIFGNAGAPCVI